VDAREARAATPPAADPGGPPAPLTPRQAEVLNAVLDYYRFMGRSCPASYIAERFSLRYHEAARGHLSALWRKGWLDNETSPVRPRFPSRRPRRVGSLFR
jgi:hypothetical protein